MGKFLRPEVLAAYIPIWSHNAIMQITWWFDMLISFIIAFAYGLFSFAEKLFPERLGGRPRVWAIPLLFAVVALGFPLVIDAFVTNVLQNLLDSLFTLPEVWITNTAACLWMAGFVVTLYCAVRDFRRFSKTVQALPACPGSPILQAALAATGISGSATVKMGAANSPIVSCGLIRTCIVVPKNFSTRYSPEQQYAILLHECIHGKKHDTLKLFCLSLVKSVLWFDPVVRHAVRRVKVETELLCDWTAVNTYRLNPATYAALVVDAASGQHQPAPGFSDQYRFLTQRLAHILRDGGISAPARVSRRGAFFTLSGLAALLVAACIFHASLPPIVMPSPDEHMDKSAEVVNFSARYGVFARYAFSTVRQAE